MKGDVPRDQPVLKAAPIQLFHHGLKIGLAAADDGIGRRVLAGDLDLNGPGTVEAKGNVRAVQQLLHARPVETDREHAAGAGRALLQGGAMEDQPRRIGKRKCARGVRRGHLA